MPPRVMSRISSLIRPQVWISWVVIGLATLGTAGLIQAGAAIDRTRPELSDVLGLRAGRACHFAAVTLLLAMTQLSLLILWHRTRSRKDFHGRYRVWIGSSMTWGLFFTAAATDWHIRAARWIGTWYAGLGAVAGERIWIVPAVILFLSTVRAVILDMGACRPSRWLLRLGTSLAVISLTMDLFGNPVSEAALIVRRAMDLLWPLALASSFLLHARYVIYVSNEATPLRTRQSRLARVMRDGVAEMWAMLPSRTGVLSVIRPRKRARTSGRLLARLASAAGLGLFRCGRSLGSLIRRSAAKSRRSRPRRGRLTASGAPAPKQLVENAAAALARGLSTLSDQPLTKDSSSPPPESESRLASAPPRNREKRRERRLQRTIQ